MKGRRAFRFDRNHVAAPLQPSQRTANQATTAHGEQYVVGSQELAFPFAHQGSLPGQRCGRIIGMDLHGPGPDLEGLSLGECVGVFAGNNVQVGARGPDQRDL